MKQPENEVEIRHLLRQLFDSAVAAANPANCLAQYLPQPPAGRTLLVAAGKAAASMANAAEAAWPAEAPMSGVALTRYGHGMACQKIEVIEASHPVPDEKGYEAAQLLLAQAQELTADDMLLFLVSGGGSALLALPAEGISIDEKKAINKALLMSGAPIGEMNTVRKHLSAIKGGRLAQEASPAQIVTLAISDVPFDDPSTIASGPTVPDPTTVEDAETILEKYGLEIPASVAQHLSSPNAETPKPGHAAFRSTSFHMIATPGDMIDSVTQKFHDQGYNITNMEADIEGEARTVGRHHAKIARAAKAKGGHQLIVSGGETTVTVEDGKPCGRGGRNVEYLLSLAIALEGDENVYALAADTDGIDGSEDNAGAIITPDTLTRARNKGLDPKAMLDGHDAYSLFEALGDLVKTGPTRTNVNDFRAMWVT